MDRYEYPESERRVLEKSLIPFAIYQFIDRRVVSLVLSDGFLRLLGYDDRGKAHYYMDHDMYADTHPDDVARVADEAVRFATEGGSYDAVYRSKMAEGGYRIIHAHGEHFHAGTGERLAIVWYTDEGSYKTGDTSHGKALNQALSEVLHEESLRKLSAYDYLTGLPSMTYFFELAEAARDRMKAEGRDAVMLFTDMSGMKFYNSKYGFSKGDELLISFARLLVKYFGNENCSRLGEDHFTVVTDGEGIEDRLREMLDEWKDINKGNALPVRIGIYRDSLENVDASSACDRAKYACDSLRSSYSSAFCFFNENMLREASDRQYIVENIDRAIEEKWIQVYYQPIVRSTNGRVCDEEALSRWIDPEKGYMSPDKFIPALEDAGLVYKLDLYVVEQVLEKLGMMKEKGIDIVSQSINLSRKDFEACDMVEEIAKRVEASEFGPEIINVEITESSVGRNLEFMKEQVERFRERGFKVWMDDFGSGYSSLDVLQSIRFDLIKFDMEFMKKFYSGDDTRIILTELMKMVNSLSIETVCEGVEREDQVEFLRMIGCSKLQGYYYSKPNPLDALFDRINTKENIGFEDPDEKDYYDAISRINLSDLSAIGGSDMEEEGKRFDALPMAIIEILGNSTRFVRSNPSYRDFFKRYFGIQMTSELSNYADIPEGEGRYFLDLARQCIKTGKQTVMDERLSDGNTVHSLMIPVATNDVTGASAVLVAVLTISDNDDGATYANIARALAADFFNIFYVNLRTDEFIEYTSDAGREGMAIERHDTDFFEKARRDAIMLLHEDDVDRFRKAFTKENIVNTIDSQKSFTLDYRLMMDGRPIYVSMKATRMQGDTDYLIIGVSNVNVQMNQRKAIEALMKEQTVYNRLKALSGDFVVMYTIDPESKHYIESSSSSEFAELGVTKSGEDFFADTLINADRLVFPEDRELFTTSLEKDSLLERIKKEGSVTVNYRMMIDGQAVPLKLKAVLVNEPDGDKLIIAASYLND